MYCPQCAAQLVDNDKFCRAYGADLKAVAVALVGQQLTSKDGKVKIKAPKKEKTWMVAWSPRAIVETFRLNVGAMRSAI